MWASIDGSGMTSEYIEFKSGYYKVFEVDKPVYYTDKTVWAVSKSDFKKIDQQEYSIINGILHLENSVSPISTSGNTLIIGKQKYSKLTDFSSKYYSKITYNTSGDLVYKYTTTKVSLNYNIDRRPAGDKVTVSCNADWIKSIVVYNDKFDFEIEENNSGKSRKAILTLSYPTASPVQIELEQTYEESKIILDNASTSCDYVGGTFDFNYEIDFPRDGVHSEVTCDAEWITSLRDNRGNVSFTIPENNSGSDRTCDIIITYGSISETHKVTQTYASPRLEISQKSITIGYQAGEYYACNCRVINPRKDCEISANAVLTGLRA